MKVYRIIRLSENFREAGLQEIEKDDQNLNLIKGSAVLGENEKWKGLPFWGRMRSGTVGIFTHGDETLF